MISTKLFWCCYVLNVVIRASKAGTPLLEPFLQTYFLKILAFGKQKMEESP
jgi:hypothetical protein